MICVCVYLLPVYLCETSDECGSKTSLKLLEAAPVCQPTDDLRRTDRTDQVRVIIMES